MSNIPYTASSNDGKNSVSLFFKGKVHVVFQEGFAEYNELILAIINGEDDKVNILINKYETLIAFAQGVPGLGVDIVTSESAIEVTPADEKAGVDSSITELPVAYTFEGEQLSGEFTKYIEEIRKSDDAPKLMRFFTLLRENPSSESKSSLFEFLKRHKVQIDEDGCILFYKGIKESGTSGHSGRGFVNDTLYENAYLPNNVGSIVSIERARVNSNPSEGCASGLHVGSYSYASSNYDRLMLIKVHPRDIVSVPRELSFGKVRCCRYQIVAEINKKELSRASQVEEFVTKNIGKFDASVLMTLTGDRLPTKAQIPLINKVLKNTSTPKPKSVKPQEAVKEAAPKINKVTEVKNKPSKKNEEVSKTPSVTVKTQSGQSRENLVKLLEDTRAVYKSRDSRVSQLSQEEIKQGIDDYYKKAKNKSAKDLKSKPVNRAYHLDYLISELTKTE